MTIIRRLKGWLIEPHAKITEIGQRRQAKLLSTLLLFVLLISVTYLISITVFWHEPDRSSQFYGGLITTTMLLAAYLLSRTQWYETAVFVFAVSFGWAVLESLRASPSSALLLIFFLLPVMLGGMVVDIRKTAVIALIEFAAILYVMAAHPAPPEFWEEGSVLIILYLTFVGLILLSMRHRDQIEQTRREQLRQQETRLRTYFDNATDWLFALDAQGRVSSINKIACQELGYSASEIIGQPPLQFLTKETQPTAKAMVQALFQGKEIASAEIVVQDKNGRAIWLEVKGRKLFEAGKIVGTFHIARNITDRKMAEDTRRKMHASIAIINASLSLEEVLKQILAQLRAAIPYDSAAIQQKEGDRLILKAARGFEDDEALMGLSFEIEANLPNAQAMRTQTPLAVDNVTESYPEFRKIAPVYQAEQIYSWLGVPLIAKSKVLGMITIDRNEIRPFSPDEITLAITFASHASMALRNAALYRELETYNEALEIAVDIHTAELQHTIGQVQAIFRNSPDAILFLNADQSIQKWNPAFIKLVECENDEILGAHFLQYVLEADHDKFKQTLATAVSNHTTHRLNLTAQSKNGRCVEVNAALAPIQENGALTGIVCSLHDISQFKEVERLKDAFVSNVSHELRTPITNLRLHHDLITLNPVKKDVYMARLGREIDRLNIIIEDLLRISRLDQKRIELHPDAVNLSALAAQYLNDRSALAKQKQLELSLATEPVIPPVRGDARLLEQVIGALLTNAMNYTPPGGHIHLTPQLKQEDGQQWAGLRISDTGPGIPEHEQQQIFTRFFRGQSALDSGQPGTGLGLAIAQEIIRLHHGRIEFDHTHPESGASFIIWLPTSTMTRLSS